MAPSQGAYELVVGSCEGESVLTGSPSYRLFREGEKNALTGAASLDEYHSRYLLQAAEGYFFLRSHAVQKGMFRVFLRAQQDYPAIQTPNSSIVLRKVADGMTVAFARDDCEHCRRAIVLSRSNESLRRYLACLYQDNETQVFRVGERGRRLLEQAEVHLISDSDIPPAFALSVVVTNLLDGSTLAYPTRFVANYDEIEEEYRFRQEVYLLAIVLAGLLAVITGLRLCKARQLLCFRTRNQVEFEVTEQDAAPAVDAGRIEMQQVEAPLTADSRREYKQFVDE